jgi:hypothetical protein
LTESRKTGNTLKIFFISPFSLVRFEYRTTCYLYFDFSDETLQIPASKPQSTFIHRVPQCLSPHRNWDYPIFLSLSRKRVCPSPPEPKGGTHPPAGDGVGESQFRRLQKKLSTLSFILCSELTVQRLNIFLQATRSKNRNLCTTYKMKHLVHRIIYSILKTCSTKLHNIIKHNVRCIQHNLKNKTKTHDAHVSAKLINL